MLALWKHKLIKVLDEPRMVLTWFLWVREELAAAFVHALLRHILEHSLRSERECVLGR